MFCFFLLNTISFSDSMKFKPVCFSVIDKSRIKVLFMFNDILPFIPNYLQMRIITNKYTHNSFVSSEDRTSFFIRNKNASCSDPFIYDVSHNILHTLVVNFTLSFGDPQVVLDEHQIVIKKDFEESEHFIDGLFGHIRILVDLKHESNNSEMLAKNMYKSDPPCHWSAILRKLDPDESFCLRLFTTEFLKPLIFSKYPTKDNQTFQYYKFTVTTSEHIMPYQLQIKEYLGKVYPCDSSTPTEKILKIYVCPYVITVSFELSENNYNYSKKIKYSKESDYFEITTNSPSFDFDKLEIFYKNLEQDMIGNKSYMLLYRERVKRIYCDDYYPEFLKELRLSYVDQSNFGSVIIYKHFRYIDQSTKDMNIYKIRIGTKSEMEMCQP